MSSRSVTEVCYLSMWGLVPTRKLWWTLAGGLLFAVGGAFAPGLERFMLPYDLCVLLVALVSGLAAKKWPVANVSRSFDPALSVRQPNRVELTLEWTLPLAGRVTLREELAPGLMPDQDTWSVRAEPDSATTVSYSIQPTERGDLTLGPLHVQFLAPLGLVAVNRQVGEPDTIRVYPNIRAVREFGFLRQTGRLREAGLRKTRARGLGTDFESLREYNDDDFRLIDWKSTARRGRLVVKNFEQERNQAVMVCLDLGRHTLGEVEGTSKLDHALDAALMVFHAAEAAGDLVGVYAFNDAVRAYVPPRRGKSQVAAVLRAVYGLNAEPVQPNYVTAMNYLLSKWKKRSLVVLFTDAENSDQADDLSRALEAVRRRHLLLVVRVKDPNIDVLLNLEPTDARSLSLRAAATWCQTDRRAASTRLAAGGVQNLEAEPQHLATALVGAYLEIKRLARL